MVEQDAVDGEQAVSVAIVARHPVGVDLRCCIRRARVEQRVLVLWGWGRSEHL